MWGEKVRRFGGLGADAAGGRTRAAGCYAAVALDDQVPNASGCVEIDPALEPVETSCLILHEIEQEARSSYPEECCGLLSGDDTVRFRHLHKCSNTMTARHRESPGTHPHDGRSAFLIDPLVYARIEEEAIAGGERVTAVYHSHVGVRAYFSAIDLAFASRPDFPFPDADHIVVAVADGVVRREERALYRRAFAGGPFRGHPLRELPA